MAALERKPGLTGSASLESLVVMLDSAAPSFCYYPSPRSSESAVATSHEVLSAAVAYAKTCELSLQVLAGRAGVRPEQRTILQACRWVCYAPVQAPLEAEDVPVLDAAEPELVSRVAAGRHTIAVLRVAPAEVSTWPEVWARLAARVRRVVLVLLGLETYDRDRLEQHRASLQLAAERLEAAYRKGEPIELNVLSDRMALREPAECNAGLAHLTVDPLGRLHLCPGFAADGDDPVGELDSELQIPNRHLLGRDRAPICSLCDAYHCRRCIYLNQRSTLEHNTPPWQACRASHIERETTRQLLARLQRQGLMRGIAPLPAVDYDDPFEKLTGLVMHDGRLGAARPAEQRTCPVAPRRPADTAANRTEMQRAGTKESVMDKPSSRTSVGRVTPAERDEIRRLFLRKTALTELFLSLGKMDAATLENTPLYDRIVQDMGAVSVEFQSWWEGKAKQYGWRSRPDGQWNIDFETCEIFLA